MSRKQLYVDWETLNKLIKAKDQKKKAIVMPDQAWYNPEPPEIEVPNAPWVEENQLLDGLQKLLEEESGNARDKVSSVSEKQYNEALNDIRAGLSIDLDPSSKTVVVVVVFDQEVERNNTPHHIHCNDGIGFGGYVKDIPKDAYILDCVDFVSLGTIPVSFTVAVPKTGGWKVAVPMPEKVVEKLLAPYYRRVLKGIREKYPSPRFALHYMQMLGCG